MRTPLSNSHPIDAAEPRRMQLGWTLLQLHRFGETDEAHTQYLLECAKFPVGARVLDVGCGVGRQAELMAQQRPDLKFTLLNFSVDQLALCPGDMDVVPGDAHRLPFEDGSFDAVMFHCALSQMDQKLALAEAHRVLRMGGVLFLNEPVRVSGDDLAMQEHVKAQAISLHIPDFCERIGLGHHVMFVPEQHTEYLRDNWQDTHVTYDEVFAGTVPGLWRFEKVAEHPELRPFIDIFRRHDNVALSLSGGKDSLACLYLLRPWLDRVTVYWCNTGDAFPETIELMERVKATVSHFREVKGRQREVHAADGWPSDVVPAEYTSLGTMVHGDKGFKVQGRIECCYRSLMWPLYEAMIADGVTCVIRGKRSEEPDRTGVTSGEVSEHGLETQFPILNWSAQDVMDYLTAANAPIPKFYEYGDNSIDCMHCTAFWGDGHATYLKAEHPVVFLEYKRRLNLIKQATTQAWAACDV